MRSFEQYINEELNFRLGGSSSKGESVKTFEELEKGDEIHFHAFEDGELYGSNDFTIRDIVNGPGLGQKTFKFFGESLTLSKDELQDFLCQYKDNGIVQVYTTLEDSSEEIAKYLEKA